MIRVYIDTNIFCRMRTKKALELKSKIVTTNKEIDQIVCKLYDLAGVEIKNVEGN